MSKFYFLLFLAIICNTLNAQNRSTEILQSMIGKIEKAKNINYVENLRDKSPFSNDTSNFKIKKSIFFGPDHHIISADKYTYLKPNNLLSRNVISRGVEYSLEADSTFSSSPYKTYAGGSFNELFGERGMLETIKKIIAEQQFAKIKQQNDTIIWKNYCSLFLITTYDSIIMNQHNYSNTLLAVDKSSLLPIYHKASGYGTLLKGDYVIGDFYIFSESVYSDFTLNTLKNDLANFKVPGYYRTSTSEKLLDNGTVAPVWEGRSPEGKMYNSKQFKNKENILLFLTETNCPANYLAVKLINKINAQYKNSGLAVIGIFGDRKERLTKFHESNKMDFPVIYDGKAIKDKYHSLGSPFFYIINKEGKIVFSQSGYSDDSESVLSQQIENLH